MEPWYQTKSQKPYYNEYLTTIDCRDSLLTNQAIGFIKIEFINVLFLVKVLQGFCVSFLILI